ncbi:MAG: tRNA 2-thiouridine synthesizing protein E [Arenicella sp.]|jgi:tRNA 2-thiouridine synthesizing protein E
MPNPARVLEFNGIGYPFDGQGFLQKRLMWSEGLGSHIALIDGVTLGDQHWEIIHYFREYYETYNIPPPMRMVMRVFKKAFGEENANSRYLHQLFPGGPTRTASKYAGLPKPKNCK